MIDHFQSLLMRRLMEINLFLSIIVRFIDKNSLEVSTRLLKMALLPSSKAGDICNALMSCLKEFKLEKMNLISVKTDNCYFDARRAWRSFHAD